MSIQYTVLRFEPTTFGTWVLPITTRPGLLSFFGSFFYQIISQRLNAQWKRHFHHWYGFLSSEYFSVFLFAFPFRNYSDPFYFSFHVSSITTTKTKDLSSKSFIIIFLVRNAKLKCVNKEAKKCLKVCFWVEYYKTVCDKHFLNRLYFPVWNFNHCK